MKKTRITTSREKGRSNIHILKVVPDFKPSLLSSTLNKFWGEYSAKDLLLRLHVTEHNWFRAIFRMFQNQHSW